MLPSAGLRSVPRRRGHRIPGAAELAAAAAAAWILPLGAATVHPARTELDIDNPHKGFMLWGTDYAAGPAENHYGATIYHVYMPWREVEPADQTFAWETFERNHLDPILDDHPEATFVLCPVADYPDGQESGVTEFYEGGEPDRDFPRFLIEPPLNIPYWTYSSCDGDGPGWTPDWNHPEMIRQMTELVAALADRYDGDPRITSIYLGILGLWGEWHQSGCDDHAPTPATREAVRDAYRAAFHTTRLQNRYPRRTDSGGTDFGFYEAFFPSFTAPCVYGFPECDDTGEWNLDWCYRHEDTAAADNWKVSPISGESPLASQQASWLNDTGDLLTVLRDYHFSFLGPAGTHEKPGHEAVMIRIKRTLGYNYHIEEFTAPDEIEPGLPFESRLVLSNSGSAPCYAKFPVEIALCDGTGEPVWKTTWNFDLREVLPGDPRACEETFTVEGVAEGTYSIRIAILNPRFGDRPGVRIQSEGEDPNHRYAMTEVAVRAPGTLDLDGDGMPDAWEHEKLGGTGYGPEDDRDRDGSGNRDEYVAGTDPSDPADRFALRIAREDSAVVVSLFGRSASGPGYEGMARFYRLERAVGALPGPWDPVEGYTNLAGADRWIRYVPPAAAAPAFYRAWTWLTAD